MKFKMKFDGNTDRKSLAGYVMVDEKGNAIPKPMIPPMWIRKEAFPDGLPDELEIEMTPVFANGKPAKAAKTSKKKEPAKADA